MGRGGGRRNPLAMKRGEERGREEKKSARREERKEKSPPPPVTHARVPESKGERRRRERDRGNRGRRERMKNDVDKTWQPSWGRNHKSVHLSGNADVVPQSGPKMKGGATK